MNRNKLIEYLRDPSSLTSESLEELEKIVAEAPYFQSARMLLAKGSGMLNAPGSKKRVASAAIFATDRPLLKKYMSGSLLFLTTPPEEKEKGKKDESAPPPPSPPEKPKDEETPRVRREEKKERYQFPKPKESVESIDDEPEDGKIIIPGIPEGALDGILDELEQDMEDLKSSRSKFADLQQQIEEDDAVSAALEKVTSDKITSAPGDQEVKDEPDAQLEEQEKESANLASEDSPEEITYPFIEDESDPLVEEKEKDVADEAPPKVEKATMKSVEESAPEEPVFSETESEDDIPVSSDNSPKKEINPEVSEESPTSEKDEESDEPGSGSLSVPEPELPEIKLESDKKREERRERRMNREKRLSSLNKLSTESIRKLEDQMWGDSDDNSGEKKTEKKSEAPTGLTKSKEAKEAKDRSEESKPAVKKSVSKTKKEGTVKKTTAKKATTSKTTTAKKASASKTKTTKKSAPKTTAKKAATKKTTAKATTSIGSAAKSTSKEGATKKSTKKKDDDDGKGDPKGQHSIIDKFIKESPSISKPDKLTKPDKDLADQSSAWNKDLASEYLAEIYLKQGNKKRAIEIYETLSLNFPEKKSYFADLISKIK